MYVMQNSGQSLVGISRVGVNQPGAEATVEDCRGTADHSLASMGLTKGRRAGARRLRLFIDQNFSLPPTQERPQICTNHTN